IKQSGQRIVADDKYRNRALNATINHYNQTYKVDQRLANLKAVAAKQPGKFDQNMSAAVHYISDRLGRPIVTRDGKPVAYKGPSKQMSTLDALKIKGTMDAYAKAMFTGTQDPKTGATLIPKADLNQAVGNFVARGYLTGSLAPWAIATLMNAYNGNSGAIGGVLQGLDPNPGGVYGGGYGPDAPANIQASGGGGTQRKPGSFKQPRNPTTGATLPGQQNPRNFARK